MVQSSILHLVSTQDREMPPGQVVAAFWVHGDAGFSGQDRFRRGGDRRSPVDARLARSLLLAP